VGVSESPRWRRGGGAAAVAAARGVRGASGTFAETGGAAADGRRKGIRGCVWIDVDGLRGFTVGKGGDEGELRLGW